MVVYGHDPGLAEERDRGRWRRRAATGRDRAWSSRAADRRRAVVPPRRRRSRAPTPSGTRYDVALAPGHGCRRSSDGEVLHGEPGATSRGRCCRDAGRRSRRSGRRAVDAADGAGHPAGRSRRARPPDRAPPGLRGAAGCSGGCAACLADGCPARRTGEAAASSVAMVDVCGARPRLGRDAPRERPPRTSRSGRDVVRALPDELCRHPRAAGVRRLAGRRRRARLVRASSAAWRSIPATALAGLLDHALSGALPPTAWVPRSGLVPIFADPTRSPAHACPRYGLGG